MKEQVAIEKSVSKQLEQATDFKCKSKEDHALGGELLRQFKEAEKKSGLIKDKVLAPLLEATKNHRAYFKPFEIGVAACIKHVKAEMDLWRAEEQRKLDEKKAKVLADGRITKAETQERKLAELELEVGNTRRYRVVQVNNLALIPREYFDLNETRLKAALMEGVVVPGAELVNETRTVTR